MWGILTASVLVFCMACGLLGLAAAKTPSNTSDNNGGGVASAGTATIPGFQAPAPTATPAAPKPTAMPKATATSTTPAPTATAAPQPTWHTVKTFSGNGISKTDTFSVTADKWKIVWTCNPDAYGSSYNLIADLKQQSDSLYDTPVSNSICTSGQADTTKGETMVYDQASDFYLDVNSEASWSFQIQVYA
jgi:hypothetical protein